LARCSATDVPTMPAPRTIASVRATPALLPCYPYIWIAPVKSAIKRLYLHAAGVSQNEGDWRARGRAWHGRPPRDAFGGNLNCRRACHPGPCCGVQTLSRRSNRGHADACLSAGGSSRPARSLGATRTDCRCHRLDNPDRPGRARHGVFGLPSWSTHAGSVFHAGAANVSARPDVFAGFRCLTRVGCGPNATLIISTAITPLTASFFTYIYLGTAVVSPLAFGLKLFLIIAGCALAATIIRRVTGQAFLEAQRERIDGLSVLAMSTFAIAAMDGVVDHFRADLLLVIELVALAFALALGMIALAALVFCASDERALS